MRKMLKIARREYNAQVRTKGFIIGLALAPLLACGGIIAFFLLKDTVDVTDKHVAILDRSEVVAATLVDEAGKRNERRVYDAKTGEKVRPAYLLEVVAPDQEGLDAQRLALSDRVRTRELFAFVEIGPEVVHPGEDREDSRITFHSKSPLSTDVREWMYWPTNHRLLELRAQEAGLDEELVNRVTQRIGIESCGLVSLDRATGKVLNAKRTNELEAVFLPFIMVMLLFLMMMMGAMPLLSSTLEEKSQRIAEILLGSITPFRMMMGKLIGGVGVSLTSLTVYLCAGFVATQSMDFAENIPFHIMPWFFLYLVSAIFMFGALLSAIGAACNEQSEAQSLMPFIMLPMLIPMFIWFAVVKEPLSGFSTVMSLVPPFTPMLMTLRLATPSGVPEWQPWVGLAGVVLFTLASVWAGGRIFRVGILMQGQPPKIGTLLRWVLRG